MASVSMATIPLSSTTHKKLTKIPSSEAFFRPLPTKKVVSFAKTNAKLEIRASFKEKVVSGLTAAAVAAAVIVPEAAEAALSGASPSLNNFLFSIGAGGVVLTAIIGAVVGVSNFDPVKRA